MKKKVRLSRPGYKKGGAPHIAEQNETIDSISSGKRNVFLDRISNAAQEQMMNQAMMEAEEQFVPPQLYNYGGVPYYNVGGNFGFAMNPQAMANQSMYANALTDANANLNNTSWLGDFSNIDFGKEEQMNIDPTTKESKSWYKDYSKGYNKAMRKMNRGQSPYGNKKGGTPNYYEVGGPYDGGYGTHGTQSFEDYERWGNSSDVDAQFAPFYKSAWNDIWGVDNSMSRRDKDISNTPGFDPSNIGEPSTGNTWQNMHQKGMAAIKAKAAAAADLERKRDLFNARRQQANQANNTSTQDILNNTGSMIEGVDPYAAAQLNAQSIANNAQNIANRSNERNAALNVETTTTNVDDALKGKTKKTPTEVAAAEAADEACRNGTGNCFGNGERNTEGDNERDLEGSMGADDVNGTSNTGTNAQGIQGNWLKAKGFRGAPVFMPIPSMNGQAGLTPGWDYEETKGGLFTPFKKQRRWSYNPQTGQNEPVSEAGDGMNQSGPNFNPELNVSNNQNQNVDYFGEKRTLGERARNMRNRFRRNEKLEGFAGDSETDVMLPGGMGAASEQGNMQFTNREPSAQYENPVPDYNTGYNQEQDNPNYIPEGGVSGPNNDYGEGWTQAEIDEQKKAFENNQRYGGVPEFKNGGPKGPDYWEKIKAKSREYYNQGKDFYNQYIADPMYRYEGANTGMTKEQFYKKQIEDEGYYRDEGANTGMSRAEWENNQRYGGVPNYFHGGVAHEPPPGWLKQMAYGFNSAMPDANTLNKMKQGMKAAIPNTMNQNRGFEDFNMLYDDPTDIAAKPFTNNRWTNGKGLSTDAKAIAATKAAKKLFDETQLANELKTEQALNDAHSLRGSNLHKQYGGVVQELTQPEIDQILAMGGKVEYLD